MNFKKNFNFFNHNLTKNTLFMFLDHLNLDFNDTINHL